MKHKRLVILLVLIFFISVFTFLIYTSTYNEELNYVVIGDSIAAGRNPYGVDDYGYTDYIRDYLEKNGKLNSYTDYAVSGYTTNSVISDINYNRGVEVNDKNINIRKALRESDLVTISIGANDLIGGFTLSNIPSLLSDEKKTKKRIDEVSLRLEELLVQIKKYAKGNIIVVGYYNPFPNLNKYKTTIDEIVDYADQKYEEICDRQNVYFVKVSSLIAREDDCLENPLDIHPNTKGYEIISKEIIKLLDNNILK